MQTSGYRKTRRFIWTLAMLVAALTCAAAALMTVWPLAQPAEVIDPRAASAPTKREAVDNRLTAQDFGASLAKFLQRPLEEPPPPKPVETVAVAPPAPAVPLPEVNLLGTAQDSQTRHSMIWLQLPGKPVQLVALGETIKSCPGEPVVERIEAGSATLKFGDRELQLKVKKVPRAQ